MLTFKAGNIGLKWYSGKIFRFWVQFCDPAGDGGQNTIYIARAQIIFIALPHNIFIALAQNIFFAIAHKLFIALAQKIFIAIAH